MVWLLQQMQRTGSSEGEKVWVAAVLVTGHYTFCGNINSTKLIVYSHSITPRLQYVIDFFTHYFGTDVKITSSEERYVATADVCKLNYSFHRIEEEEIWIHPHPLLSESAVRPVKVECFVHEGHKAFFKTEGDFPFDIFAAIFFLLTRYEEYLPHKKDEYGRYAHTNSVAFKEGFLHLPLVNLWLEALRKLLVQKCSQFTRPANRFLFVPTYDIDMAWSYQNKGFKRNAGAMAQWLLKGDVKKVVHRVKVLSNKAPDPFDCFDWLEKLHQQHGLQPIYFFLVADKTNKLDKNISVKNKAFQHLIHDIARNNVIGLHPSWHSGDVHYLIRKEKGTLELLSGRNINASRQHFIRFTLPQTYRRLLDAGITNDYSMGYGSINGFRASVATPFNWYDLHKEEPTPLLVHPFCFMDANSFYELKFTAAEALDELKFFLEMIQSVQGTMYTIWHNSFLGTDPEFAGWRETYEQFIAMTK